ncbi:hypothetical protein [Bdellovibrio sp. KM01]|uniref:hypothetical protein n=1 Tax=Bdellovibrio sp. KM01 TaxID=2748865 RepID=UPI0015E962E0|nr:hypothetical protein [Bdellovibrio sp. KM01]QLY25358.1 hypothetical protein HW988_18410 [Bdellovibrio sp. KM01]
MVRKYFSALIGFSIFTAPLVSNGAVLFEGYSKINANDAHIGYVVSRYEFDDKKKQFISTYFIKTGKGPTETTESLKAFADAELAPISYEYTSLSGKESKTIDAKFKAGAMTAIVSNNGKSSKIEKKIPKGTFLSTFLVYLMLKSKDGLRSETKYEYQAIAEEDASISKGQALVGKEQIFNDFKVFKILNTFKDAKFLSYVNDRGEVIATNAMGTGISTELVSTAAEATNGQSFSTTILKTLFAGVPAGTQNVVAQGKKAKPATLPTTTINAPVTAPANPAPATQPENEPGQ